MGLAEGQASQQYACWSLGQNIQAEVPKGPTVSCLPPHHKSVAQTVSLSLSTITVARAHRNVGAAAAQAHQKKVYPGANPQQLVSGNRSVLYPMQPARYTSYQTAVGRGPTISNQQAGKSLDSLLGGTCRYSSRKTCISKADRIYVIHSYRSDYHDMGTTKART